MKFQEKRGLFYNVFFALKGDSATEIFENLQIVYSNSTPSFNTFSGWVNEFKWGRQTVEDEPRPGRPICVSDEVMCKNIHELVDHDIHLKLN